MCLQVHLLDSYDPWNAKPVVVQPRQQGVEYFVEHHDGTLYIMTNACDEGEMCIVMADASEPPKRYNALMHERLKASPSLLMSIQHVQTNKSQAAPVQQAVQQFPIRKCKSTGHDWPMLHKLAKLCSLRLVFLVRVQRNEW